jgi:general secretion pathway protein B
MSYILDALNKAEKERGIKKLPASLSGGNDSPPRRRSRWVPTAMIGIGLALILVALQFVITVHYRLAGTTAVEMEKLNPEGSSGVEIQPPPASAGGIAPAGLPAEKPPQSPDPSASGSPAPGAARPGTPAFAGQVEIAPEKKGTQAGTPLPSDQPVKAPLQSEALSQPISRSLPAAPAAPPTGATTAMTQPREVLSPAPQAESRGKSLKEAVRGMTISILAYSETPSERRVFINGRKYVEGDYVEERYFVESITLDGVVLNCDGEKTLLRPGLK